MNRAALLLVGVLVLLGAVYVAGRQSGGPPPTGAADAVRLGPEPGEQVAGYLARLPGLLPAAAAGPVPALVQFDAELDAPATLAAVAGARPVQVVFRVPLTRVQTALRFQRVEVSDGADVATVAREVDFARQRAERDATGDATTRTGRAAVVAAAEARALAQPCGCLLAVLVHADRAVLDAIEASPGVRAVHAAAPGTAAAAVALAPLLPEQLSVVIATPDDGPVSAG